MPKLTVLMPVYNGGKFLKEAIESILNQTFADFEFLIIDDKSQDGSKDIALSFRDKRIRFMQNEKNLGQTQTLNKGIGHSLGQYIARIDQDDRSLPQRLEKEINILDKFEEVSLVYSDSFIIDEGGKRRKKTLFDYVRPSRSFVFENLLKRNFISGNTVMLRKSIFKETGMYNPGYSIAAEYDLFLRLARIHKVDFLNEPLAEYRLHGANNSADTEKATKEIIVILTNFDSSPLGKNQKKILNKANSFHLASLGMYYLSQGNRKLCKANAGEALKKDFFNAKAIIAIFLATFFPQRFIGKSGSFREGLRSI